jgi:hypothetical protein
MTPEPGCATFTFIGVSFNSLPGGQLFDYREQCLRQCNDIKKIGVKCFSKYGRPFRVRFLDLLRSRTLSGLYFVRSSIALSNQSILLPYLGAAAIHLEYFSWR